MSVGAYVILTDTVSIHMVSVLIVVHPTVSFLFRHIKNRIDVRNESSFSLPKYPNAGSERTRSNMGRVFSTSYHCISVH